MLLEFYLSDDANMHWPSTRSALGAVGGSIQEESILPPELLGLILKIYAQMYRELEVPGMLCQCVYQNHVQKQLAMNTAALQKNPHLEHFQKIYGNQKQSSGT